MFRLLLLALLLVPALARADEATIEGRVFTPAGPLAGAQVRVYRNYSDIGAGAPLHTSSPTNGEGLYQLRLPPGSYYFTATGERDGKSFFAYHGNNPVRTERGPVWLTLMANVDPGPPAYVAGPSGIQGRVTYKGEPVPGAYVALYPPESRTFKGLGVKTESAGADGRFRLAVPVGSYVAVGKKISSGKSNRPLQKGDLYCYYPHNPVEVKADQLASIELACYPKVDRGSFAAAPTIKGDAVRSVDQLAAAAGAGIRGTVTDAAGKPVPGIMVLAYPLEAPVFMMYQVYHGSEYAAETDATGSYFIPLDQAGDYGIVARDILGDGPHRGEVYGLYQGNVRHAVTFRTGELVDRINITVGTVMAEPARQTASRQLATTEPAVVGRPGGPPVVLTDRVISSDTVWQGEILVQGVISVKRGVTLTIRPGTVVKFARLDRDRNDIGDGEILVEGRLVARGTREQRIRFTSAEARPAVNDWSYVQFLAADPGSVLEYCQFEHAFAGVMIHYAEVAISDCLFRGNNRGLHYNTATLRVEHTTFEENRIGIRFMRFEGDVRISDNQITRNDVGVLFVRQHVNAVDFDRLNRGTEPPRFINNNIFANHKYNVSLGEGQDLDFWMLNNWWGSAVPAEVAETVFDRSKDDSLSRILVEPMRSAPVAGAGVRN